MEEKFIEQPETNLGGAQLENESGSIAGKFKDATSLLNAYNNLQAEFTRKSQELANLKKTYAEESVNKSETLTNENFEKTSENDSCKKVEENGDFDTVLSQKLLNFAENNPNSLSHINEIKDELLKNKELVYMQNGIDIASRLSMEKQKSTPAEIVNNPQFVDDYILNNKDITEKIIDKYIKSLASTSSPKVIGGDSGYVPISENQNKPKTLSDANKIFAKMLEK